MMSRVVKKLLPFLGLILGSMILIMSLWRQNVRQIEKEIGSDAGLDRVGLSYIIFPEPVVLTDEPLVLPDNPVYFLQMVRDRWEIWATRGIEEKVRLSVSHAGARLKVAQVLFSRGMVGSAAASFFKGERYLSVAVDELKRESAEKDEYRDEWELILNSAKIHEESVNLMLKYVPKGRETIFSKIVEENRRINDEARNQLGLTSE